MVIRKISVEHIEYSAHTLTNKMLAWNEPIPDFSTRYPNVLESCINTPFQKYSNKDLYKGLEAKTAILFYLMIKNHPFQNGNKRIAVTTLFVFLSLNKKWLEVDTTALYNFAVWVAQSPPDAKEEIVQFINKFIKKYIVDY